MGKFKVMQPIYLEMLKEINNIDKMNNFYRNKNILKKINITFFYNV